MCACVYLRAVCNGVTEIYCNSGHCVPLSYICDGDNDCSDASDERHCHDSTVTPLPGLSAVFYLLLVLSAYLQYNTIQYKTYNAPYVTKMLLTALFSYEVKLAQV